HRVKAKPELLFVAPPRLRGGYALEKHDVTFARRDLDRKIAPVLREVVGEVLFRNRHVLRWGLLFGRDVNDVERALRLRGERPIAIFEDARRLAGIAQQDEEVDIVLVRTA